MTAIPIQTWPRLRGFALGLNLPEVTIDYPFGRETLKAFGKLWCHWSPHADAAVFRASHDERELLMQADPDTFILHPHFAKHDYVLVCAGRIDPAWPRARLIVLRRENAPKRFLKDRDARNV